MAEFKRRADPNFARINLLANPHPSSTPATLCKPEYPADLWSTSPSLRRTNTLVHSSGFSQPEIYHHYSLFYSYLPMWSLPRLFKCASNVLTESYQVALH
ncbi:uncharacterized protein AKAW2_11344A [Aspergillus luchuensis]|uniref:Uncharacterized protein n=1 Tax=Aspergillus kawachii TaxID=1069201 RepID=A0A7R7W1L8_ASPKA|nr:uncharacterized protein AKAW2_11344A [Aspergillus luchuensis]BCR94298.1 hypothetical protein AKAW2_11344A [Aspergillus luchuensis]BCS06905.1 hypothetical protein ALUC_11286A [Aspergillus luchuensis]